MSLTERLAERTKPFLCQNCWVRSGSAYAHPTLGPVCPICLRPMVPLKRKTKRKKPLAAPGTTVMSAKLQRVADRDHWTCHLCFQAVDPDMLGGQKRPTLDHLIPRSHGGTDALDNLKLAHAVCNNKRGNAVLPEIVRARKVARKEKTAYAMLYVDSASIIATFEDGNEAMDSLSDFVKKHPAVHDDVALVALDPQGRGVGDYLFADRTV